MSSTSHIKCANCGVFNTDREYCENCNQLISHTIIRQEKESKTKQREIKETIAKLEKQTFVDTLRKHPFFLVKFFGWILHSVWLLLNIIGGLIAWFVAMVAAG
ncbi:MAG: hypothetical protein HWD85_00395 [Flavobacteriaceae bacterium]|nr:hypothetical protein [Flavobacteriaceae bacterium]